MCLKLRTLRDPALRLSAECHPDYLFTHFPSFCGHTTESRALAVGTVINFSFRKGSNAEFFVNITYLKLSLNPGHSYKSLNQ